MTRDSGDQPTRRTVAELLAQHGGAKPGGAPRRRHRRPDNEAQADDHDVTTTAPQAIIDRIHSEMPEVDWQSRGRNGHSHDGSGTRHAPAPRSTTPRAPSGYNQAVPPAENQRSWPQTSQHPSSPGLPVSRAQPPPTQQPTPPQAQPPQSPKQPRVPKPKPPKRPPAPRPPVDELTDQFEAVDLDTATEASEPYGYRDPYPVANGYRTANGYPALNGYPADHEDLDAPFDDHLRHDEADMAGMPDEADDRVDQAEEADEVFDDRSPGQQWLAVAAQLTLGVVGGAGVWLSFNWLWTQIPAVALGAALLVIAGLVWIVRKIRKAEDLQTTVLAVLVGLVVTISPAALLLLDR